MIMQEWQTGCRVQSTKVKGERSECGVTELPSEPREAGAGEEVPEKWVTSHRLVTPSTIAAGVGVEARVLLFPTATTFEPWWAAAFVYGSSSLS